MTIFEALFVNPLLLTALLVGLAASISGGIVGSYVVVRRIVFLSGSIAHAVLGGMGLCLWLQRAQGITAITPLQGALLAALLAVVLITWIEQRFSEREDTVIAAMWSVGMALGILFVSQTPGYNIELTNILIGNILWVTPKDLYTLLALDGAVLASALLFHRQLLAICFDPEQARLQGLPVGRLYFLLLVLVAMTTVTLVQVVGIVLVLTMLAIPAAVANLFTRSLSRMMLLACLLNAALVIVGLIAAYELDWPVGATIALLAGLTYLVALVLKK